jgi:hypothetical protein
MTARIKSTARILRNISVTGTAIIIAAAKTNAIWLESMIGLPAI